MKTIIWMTLLCVLLVYVGTFTDAISESKLATLKKRVGMIEKRVLEDVALMREEFGLELNEFKQSHVAGSLVSTENDAARYDNNDDDRFVSMQIFENLEKDLSRQIVQLMDGFKTEKIWKRDVQQSLQLEQQKTEEIVRVLSEIGHNVSSHIGHLSLDSIGTKLNEMIDILKELKDNQTVEINEDEKPAVDCAELYRRGHVFSGDYMVYPSNLWRPLHVYCDMDTDGGGWTVFQRRCDGSENFTRSWNDYRFGFGNLTGEFWLGNEYVSRMTSQAPHELRIELEDFENDRRYAKYAVFDIAPNAEQFKLTIDDFSGTVNDSLDNHHNNRTFSTYDRGASRSCARVYKGGFWYNSCHTANINGEYLNGHHSSYGQGVTWGKFKGYRYSLKFTEMKFRPK